ncbi:MAG: hypothetical protein KF788_13970 [Piscinibacter sp.]|nr:hypothetical protein [Piscinibacter sp.]
MALNRIRVENLRRRNPLEWIATMEVGGDRDPSSYAGTEIVESFGNPRIYGRMMQNSDLRPEYQSEHQGNVRRALETITPGRAGTFTVDGRGRFLDYHGGHGFTRLHVLEWFTEAALRRGIGWYFEQRYRCNGRQIGRYRVIRICTPAGVEVRKQAL